MRVFFSPWILLKRNNHLRNSQEGVAPCKAFWGKENPGWRMHGCWEGHVMRKRLMMWMSVEREVDPEVHPAGTKCRRMAECAGCVFVAFLLRHSSGVPEPTTEVEGWSPEQLQSARRQGTPLNEPATLSVRGRNSIVDAPLSYWENLELGVPREINDFQVSQKSESVRPM